MSRCRPLFFLVQVQHMPLKYRHVQGLLLCSQVHEQQRLLLCSNVHVQLRPMWCRHVQAQLGSVQYSIDTSRCISGPCGVDYRVSTEFRRHGIPHVFWTFVSFDLKIYGPRFFRKSLPTHLCPGDETRRQIVGWSGLTAGREDWIVRPSIRVYLSTTCPILPYCPDVQNSFAKFHTRFFEDFFNLMAGSLKVFLEGSGVLNR